MLLREFAHLVSLSYGPDNVTFKMFSLAILRCTAFTLNGIDTRNETFVLRKRVSKF